ncbi:hypothetical protein CKO25_07830 [Thiocapsa imhoffii]|uniref:G domain-containing protein n=1 Tax=Thiocapsa imhoffii TaxID=382777 RepID=A0A9X0WHT9_9GAMM|nr:GTPase [Thiocapsa imhoffii]MBK1644559.1 hypothetical protein [Thiocapsa imhoffii]
MRSVNDWSNRWRELRAALLDPRVDDARLDAAVRAASARHPKPVVWLIGKTQSGKTSIIRALTGSAAAEIGNGFQPCTATTRLYDYPFATPLVRFLDTRGLGEVGYDPREDITYCESQAHLLLAVMKATDVRQDEIFAILRTLRGRHPEWPLVIAQTGLHDGYPPDGEHLLPYPYGREDWPRLVPADLARALLAQRERLGDLPGSLPVRWIPIDLTLPEDGFTPTDYGLDALWEAIDEVSALHLQARLRSDEAVRDAYARSAHPHILGYAAAAAGLGAVPIVDLIGVPAIQAKMLQSLAAIYGQAWDRRAIAEFLALLGTGIGIAYAARSAGRAVVKLIPVWGQTAGAVWGATASGATTYALGKAAGFHFNRRRRGLPADAAGTRRAFAEGYTRGSTLLKDLTKPPRP